MPPLDTLHDNWFINLSGIDIPLEVQYLLQLGEKFGLPIDKYNKDSTLIEFIKHIENNIIGRPNNVITLLGIIPFHYSTDFTTIFLLLHLLTNWFLNGYIQ